MNHLTVLYQAPTILNACVGLSLTSLLGAMGAAAATVAAVHCFVGFLQHQGERRGRIIEQFKDCHAESQRKFQSQLDRLSDRHEEDQLSFQAQIDWMSSAQNIVLRDVIATMKSIEHTGDGSSLPIHRMQPTAGIHRISDRVRKGPRCDPADEDVGTELLPLASASG